MSSVAITNRRSGRSGRMVPVAPLLAAIEVECARGGRSLKQLAADCKVGERRVRDWRSGRASMCEEWTADKVLTHLGLLWWDCYDAERWPAEHEVARRVFG